MIRSATEHPFQRILEAEPRQDRDRRIGLRSALLPWISSPPLDPFSNRTWLHVNDAILIPLWLLFLAVMLLGLYLGTRHHHEPWALILGGLSALVIAVVFLGLVPSRIVASVGMAGLVAASILNVWLRTRQLSSR
jgi:hypothetical protein